jgi:mannose-6-phosphate isomerase
MVLSLTCAVQNYDWGITGTSEVSSLGAANTGVPTDPTKPYAELWMGTHPSGPSVVAATGVGLKETIAADAAAHLGGKTLARFGEDLPFLTKVLSVSKALSIQAHPDKTLAAQLHADRPHVYKDANHKPEMTLAVTPFEALCAFVPTQTLAKNLASVPELRAVVGEETAAEFVAVAAALAAADPTVAAALEAAAPGMSATAARAALAAVFTAVMTADAAAVAAQVDALAARLSAADAASLSPTDALAVRLNQQYPQDVGVLCAYILNYVTLQPG